NMCAVGVVKVAARAEDLDRFRTAARKAFQQPGMQPLLDRDVGRDRLEHSAAGYQRTRVRCRTRHHPPKTAAGAITNIAASCVHSAPPARHVITSEIVAPMAITAATTLLAASDSGRA